jgi:predicted DNA-binding transcriptional regulator AlpA
VSLHETLSITTTESTSRPQTPDDFPHTTLRGIEMQNPGTYDTEEMTQIFKKSRSSLYREIKEAREGRSNFPLPIQTGPKRSLRWSAESVRKFLLNGNDAPPTSPTLKIESAKSRRGRHLEAMKKLEQKGVRVNRKQQDG